MWFVSRQSYWGVDPEDQYCVEIAAGGLDYANPDMLAVKYDGEGEEYEDPREAVEAAIKIRDAWKAEMPDKTINVAHGATLGCSMLFFSEAEEALKAWAAEKYESLPKCARCGELLKKGETYALFDSFDGEEKYCSSYCAEKEYDRLWEEAHKEEVDA